MESPPFTISTLVNQECFAKTLVDTGCLAYGVIDSHFAKKKQPLAYQDTTTANSWL
jgi:hypothetical protein